MKPKCTTSLPMFAFLTVLFCVLFLSAPADASIAKISNLKGEVIVQSGEEVYRLEKTGRPLNSGDHIMTKEGEAQVTFYDGAVLKLNPFSKAMIAEREEESGVWLFKSKKPARRITVYTGKIWFKSGASNIRNYVQTPAAVCTLRGSDGDFGFNPATLSTYMHMYSGEASVVGTVIRGFFANPGISAAQKSAVYQALASAYEKTQQAAASGNTAAKEQAKIDALQAAKLSAAALQGNPDATVKTQASAAAATLDASIAAAGAKIAVEELKAAEKEAKSKGATQAANEASQAVALAEQLSNQSATAAEEAKKAADQLDVAAAQKAAQEAQRQSNLAKQTEQTVTQKLADSGVITTTVQTTAATTVAPTTLAPTTLAPTTAPMTTIETTSSTTSTTTTSSTSTSTVKSPSK